MPKENALKAVLLSWWNGFYLCETYISVLKLVNRERFKAGLNVLAYYDAALWAKEKGMVSGSRFEGNTPCTRAYTVIYLWKNAGSPTVKPSGAFADVDKNADYAQAVAWALENGVTSGTSDTTFSPNDTCTRGQIVTFLKRS